MEDKETQTIDFPTPPRFGERSQREPEARPEKVMRTGRARHEDHDIARHQGVAPSTIFRFLQRWSRMDRP